MGDKEHLASTPSVSNSSSYSECSTITKVTTPDEEASRKLSRIEVIEEKKEEQDNEPERKEKWFTILGFGSLLSVKSAASTFKRMANFRVGMVFNFRRLFGHAAPIFIERGIGKWETKEVSSLSAEPCEGSELIVTAFEIPQQDLALFYKREDEFLWLDVPLFTLDKTPDPLAKGRNGEATGIICAMWNDEDFMKTRLNGSKELFYQRYGRWGVDRIWRNDVFPCRVYLRHCVLAAQHLDQKHQFKNLVENNFLDVTVLSDRKTTIREYLKKNPAIMDELPPANVAEEYAG